MSEPDRDRQPPEEPPRPEPSADRPATRPRLPLADRLREKLEKLRRDDRNVYPLY